MYSSWFQALLLVLSVASGSLVSLSTGCKEKNLTWQRVKAGSDVLVPCTNVTADEVSLKLFLNKNLIISSTWSSNNTQRISPKGGVNLQVDKSIQGVHFLLSHVQANWTGLYRCEAEILYPPPYKKLPDEETVVIVEETHCNTQGMRQCPPAKDRLLILWVMVCGVLAIFSLVMTGIAAILWHKLKSKHFQNDYMNMKPRVFRKHVRVQHPNRMDRY